MGVEIERKFLVKDDSWRSAVTETIPMEQGYIGAAGATVRIRRSGDRAWITLKGRSPDGLRRSEYEYPIPAADAAAMLAEFCAGRRLAKTRCIVPFEGRRWEVDVFSGPHEGLVTAELELSSPDEDFPRPPWLGEEVSHDPRYRNAALAASPPPERRGDR